MKVLLAIDDSATSEEMVKEVIARPWPHETVIRVISVIESERILVVPAIVEKATAAARALVETAAKSIVSRGLEASSEVVTGHPRTRIVEYAREWGADLILVGWHGHSGLTRFLLGSVARGVVRGAHCSVEIVRSKTRTGKGLRIFLATDGSEFSLAAARSIAARPWPDGSEVKVLSVIQVVVPGIEPWYVDTDIMEVLQEEANKQAQKAVADARDILSGTGLKITSDTPTGLTAETILDEAKKWEAGIIVVGSHGRHGATRLLLGSISEAVATHAHCSVEVIRGKMEDE
jgi:nucleotide-binding universal stress UspA family protein